MRVIGIALLVFTVSHRAVAQANPAPPRIPEITASGRGEVPITPDRATVFVSVETRAPTASAAAADNSTKMSAVRDAIKRSGLNDSDITTSGYSVGQDPRSLFPPSGVPSVPTRPVEFVARNSLRLDVRRPADVGKIIDAALTGGATSISSVQFSSPATDEARRQAIAVAAVQAQRDADALARAAGGSLGRLLSMSSTPITPMQGYYPSDTYFTAIAAGSASMAYPTMINPRDMSVSVSVFGRWEFVPGH